MNKRLLALLSLALVSGAIAAPAGSPPPSAATLAERAEAELRKDILPFWLKHARDPKTGKFIGSLSNDLTVAKPGPRGTILAARILWTYSAAYRHYPEPAYLEMAKAAYADLENNFRDPQNGGYYWMIDGDGHPVDPGKQTYAESFALYGLSEFARATGDKAALDRAIEIYRLLEQHAFDQEHGGYVDLFTRDWKVPPPRGFFSFGGAPGPKSQNTMLHLMESYTNLLRVWPDPDLRKALRSMVDVMLTRVLDPEGLHVRQFFSLDWKPTSDDISFGHDIEFSWLLTETAEVLGDAELIARTRQMAVAIAQDILKRGIDPDGGLVYEGTREKVTNGSKDWWPQAEAAVGFVNAYQISGDPKFLTAAQRSWAFIEQFIIDHQNGEWFWGVNRTGTVRSSAGGKIGFWKCPYHNSRACLELMTRLRAPGRAAEVPTK